MPDICELATHNDRGDSFKKIADEIEALPVRVVDLNEIAPTAAAANAKAR